MSTTEEEEVYTTQQVADMLGTCRETIRRHCARGGFPNARRNTLGWQIPASDVEAHKNEQ